MLRRVDTPTTGKKQEKNKKNVAHECPCDAFKKKLSKRTMPLGAPLYSFCLPFSKYDESVTARERQGE
jgi:hypothetical protein